MFHCAKNALKMCNCAKTAMAMINYAKNAQKMCNCAKTALLKDSCKKIIKMLNLNSVSKQLLPVPLESPL